MWKKKIKLTKTQTETRTGEKKYNLGRGGGWWCRSGADSDGGCRAKSVPEGVASWPGSGSPAGACSSCQTCGSLHGSRSLTGSGTSSLCICGYYLTSVSPAGADAGSSCSCGSYQVLYLLQDQVHVLHAGVVDPELALYLLQDQLHVLTAGVVDPDLALGLL